MTIDIFVHPNFATVMQGGYPNKELLAEYDALMKEKVKASKLPILINGYLKDNYSRLIPKTQQFDSKVFFPQNGYSHYRQTGILEQDNLERLVKIVDSKPRNNIVVHGSYFGQCTMHVAVQLMAHLGLAELWSDWLYSDNLIDSDSREQRSKLRTLVKDGAFRQSRIKCGIVLFPHDTEIKVIKAQDKNLLDVDLLQRSGYHSKAYCSRHYPHGNINYQLINSKTKVFGTTTWQYQLSIN